MAYLQFGQDEACFIFTTVKFKLSTQVQMTIILRERLFGDSLQVEINSKTLIKKIIWQLN